MLTTNDARELIDQVFEQEALVVGGLIALYPVEDRFIWRLMRNLAVIRRRVVAACEQMGDRDGQPVVSPHDPPTPHPAIEEFLEKLGRAT